MSLPRDYDELLSLSPQASIYATRWWLEAVAPGAWEILEVRADNRIRAAWPVVSVRDDDGARHLLMPGLTQRLGILYAPIDGKSAEVQSTKQRLAQQLIEQVGGTASFHQNFHEAFTDWLPFHWKGYAQTTRYTYLLEDLSDLDAVWDGMRGIYRNIVRKAEKGALRVADLPLTRFLEVNRKTFERQSLPPPAPDAFIERLDAALAANAGRRVFAAVDAHERVHAAVYLAWWNGVAYYLLGGSDTELRSSGAHILALWEAVKFASTVATKFDFEGSMLPLVEPVFRGFGATQTPYFAISKMPSGPSSLGGYVKYAVDYRLRRLRRRFKR